MLFRGGHGKGAHGKELKIQETKADFRKHVWQLVLDSAIIAMQQSLPRKCLLLWHYCPHKNKTENSFR